jgi:hypothetical protein
LALPNIWKSHNSAPMEVDDEHWAILMKNPSLNWEMRIFFKLVNATLILSQNIFVPRILFEIETQNINKL